MKGSGLRVGGIAKLHGLMGGDGASGSQASTFGPGLFLAMSALTRISQPYAMDSTRV